MIRTRGSGGKVGGAGVCDGVREIGGGDCDWVVGEGEDAIAVAVAVSVAVAGIRLKATLSLPMNSL